MKETPMWKKTIFAQFENLKLKNVLIEWAKEHQLNIVWGKICLECFKLVF
jgi:hypothetical protein